MIDKTGAFKARIVNILKENEFSETINHIKDDFIDSIASDIAKSIIVKKATDDELRLEVKRYFEEYFDTDTLECSEEYESQKSNFFATYNEQLDSFVSTLESMSLTPRQKEELLLSVANISNYALYNLMLTRCLTNAVYSHVDKDLAEEIIKSAINGVDLETNIMFQDIDISEKTGKTLYEVTKERQAKEDNVIKVNFSDSDKRILGFKLVEGGDK